MAMVDEHAPAQVINPLYSQGGTSAKLHFSLLTQAEKASFEAGLRTRLWSRLYEAVKAPTAGEYVRARNEHLLSYHHLLELLRLETGHAAEPITDERVMQALAHVQDALGEPWRHKLEHAINESQSALRIMARVHERPNGADVDPGQGMLFITRWLGGWITLNWAIDCVLAATDDRVIVQPDVVAAVFNDVRDAANNVYGAACEAHDARFGDPDADGE